VDGEDDIRILCVGRWSLESGVLDLETVRAALSLVELQDDFAWTTIVDSRGSSPRHTGTCMLVRHDSSFAGTIGGGPLEAAILEHASRVLQTKQAELVHFDSARLGMACGGGGLVLIEYVDSSRPATRELYTALFDLLGEGCRGWLVMAVTEEDREKVTAQKCLVRSDGSVVGDPAHPLESLQDLARRGGTYDEILANRPAQTFIQPLGARGKAYVFGAGHCGEKLAPVLSALGFFTTVIDDRPDFANPERFPTADRIVVPPSFDGVVQNLGIEEDGYVVIMTRGHRHDRSVLAQALKTRARYLGMMGSRNKVAQTFQALEDEGFTALDLERVCAPIGLPIGGETPEEIAISVAAQLVQARGAKDGWTPLAE
jgi:xanthine dehydrogenase accessory factor